MKKLLVLSVVFIITGHVSGFSWPPDYTDIDPPNPTSGDVVNITVGGEWSNSCVPNDSIISVVSNNIYFDVIWDYPPDVKCASVISPWSQTESVGPLSSGTYYAYACLIGHPFIPETYTLITSFIVTRRIYIDGDGSADYTTIQAAINDANDGDTVVVADGTYTGPGNRDIDFLGKAITIRSENGPENCIIDPNGSETEPYRGFYIRRGEGADSVVDGFTITNGYATKGGGICCINDSSPTISNCFITENTAIGNYPNGGGGVYCYNFDGNPTISHCSITNNSGGYGSGIFWFGDGTISYCTISDNTGIIGVSKGGGIYTDSFSCTITYCAITDNTAMSGGGIYCWGTEPTISHCSITDNVATGTDYYQGGGGIRLETALTFVENCIIANNSAYRGGGIYSEWCNEATITNCTITGNMANIGGGYCDESSCLDSISNCILCNNTALGGSEIGGWASAGTLVEYSDVQGGFSGTGNIDAEPDFADPNNGDYHLKSQSGRWDANTENWFLDDVTSPCIDAGNPGCPLGDESSDPNNVRINMGAYGGTAEASKTPAGWGLLADLTNDWKVDYADFAGQADDWQQTANCLRGDLDRDGTVNLPDIALAASDWLNSRP